MTRWTPADLAATTARITAGRASPATVIPYERDVVKAVLDALALCPSVAWFQRMNVGQFKVGERVIRCGFVGCADVIGMLRGGTFLAIECKRPSKNPTEEQLAFLCAVSAEGGMAFVARCADDVFTHLRPTRPHA